MLYSSLLSHFCFPEASVATYDSTHVMCTLEVKEQKHTR